MRRQFIPVLTAFAVAVAPIAVPTLAPARALAEESSGAMPSEFSGGAGQAKSNQFWWPELLDLAPLRDHDARSNPYGEDFDYAAAFADVDYDALTADLRELMTTSQDWWPADYGHYGPFFIRMSWHAAGTYRTSDGRGGAGGGQQRFEPLNSWPDNANLDKARRLLWPIKQKYGRSVSWADLIVLAGTVAMDDMGFETFGFAGGREDDWEPDLVYWGPELELGTSDRFDGEGNMPAELGATVMGLIYVNPEGPGGSGDPRAAAERIRLSFGRMAMGDEETVALIAGGHTFGKNHGAAPPADCVGPAPAGEGIEEQGLGWNSECGKGNAEDTITSGLEGAWTAAPTRWTMMYLENLFAYEWERTESPAGAIQWVPAGGQAEGSVPDAHVEGRRHQPVMLTTDLSLKEDPIYREISRRFLDNPEQFEDAFARAWFKLTHRDMGPKARYVGGNVPPEALVWQDPVPEVDHPLVDEDDIAELKAEILDSGLTVGELVRTAWGAAASYRDSDMRGGANGARIRLAPQKDWAVNDPAEVEKVLGVLTDIRDDFNRGLFKRKEVSLADLIVLGGAAAIEKAASDAGHDVNVPFTPGRTDATQAQTDVASFVPLEPKADGFRNYYSPEAWLSPTEALVDRADLLTLSVPEMTALVGGMRALGANTAGAGHGLFTERPGQLTNDFFVNLLDMSTRWSKSEELPGVYEGHDRVTGELKWTATPVDLIFGSHSELRAVAEAYAEAGGEEAFLRDFVTAWHKVMMLDRFEI